MNGTHAWRGTRFWWVTNSIRIFRNKGLGFRVEKTKFRSRLNHGTRSDHKQNEKRVTIPESQGEG